MRRTTFRPHGLTVGAALMLALLSPLAASAQSQLDASQAQAFIGNWTIAMDTDFGPFSMDLEITEQGGKVAASIGSPEMGGPMQSVTDITREGEALVLSWEIDAQGQYMDVMMSLEPDGEDLATMFETAGGEFAATGVATKAD